MDTAAGRHRYLWPALAVVAVVSIAARAYTSSPLWLDEALTVNIARLPLGDLVDALRRDGNPPLYYGLLHVWTGVFGDGDIAARSLSGVFAVAALPLAWIAGSRAAGPRAGAWAVALIGLSPFAVRYATEARMYSLVMLLVLAGQILIRSTLARPSPGRLVALGAVSGALLLTHYWAIWLVVAAVAVLLLADRRGQATATARRVAVAVRAGAVVFLTWLPVFVDQVRHTGTPWGGVFRPSEAAAATVADLGGDYTEGLLLGALVVGLAVVGAFGRRARTGSLVLGVRPAPPMRAELVVAVLAFALGTVSSVVSGATFASRYASVSVPLVLLVAAAGAAALPRVAAITVAALVVVFGLGGIAVNVRDDRTQAREVADQINAAAEPGDVVVYCPDQRGPAVSRLLDPGFVQLTFPDLDRPELIDWRDYTERVRDAEPEGFARAVDDRAANHTVWFVSSSSYSHGRTCTDVGAALAGRRGPAAPYVAEDGTEFFEPMSVVRFEASQ